MQNKDSRSITKVFIFMGVFLFGGLLFFTQPSIAVPLNMSDDEMPIKVNADDMVYDMDKNTVTFIGNVVVVRGDFVMESAKMRIFLQEKETKSKPAKTVPKNIPLTGAGKTEKEKNPSGKNNNIERIEAFNGVEFDYGTQSGTSESAVYEAQKGLLTMRGNPVVRDGENIIQGNTIRYYMFERRSEVIGSDKKRVEAIFTNN